ncbi:GIY-YIG nuclease family protein [candidate division WOR-3 bacterium]|nr:GIY-YIG nuclease family protein [candidate division WOR-3 bacterium]
MYYIYLLRSQKDTSKTYIGFTNNLKRRIEEHNKGKSLHTKLLSPWLLEVYIAFKNKNKAKKFETYLKQGSGHAFAKRHFWEENP